MTPERIAHYRILSRLGAGGMGEVFVAEDARLNRKVAIKRVRPDVLDSHAHRRLLVEAQAAARLDHPNICAIFEAGDDGDGPYIVMPLVEGDTLAARIAQQGPLTIEAALGVAAQVTDALAAAHAQGILHRDIKPANIMIDTRGQARVMDFGLAKFTETVPAGSAETGSALTRFGNTLGTAAYMSPEQARGESLDARTDLFSIGIVMYEMVAGRRPFDGPSIADTVSAILNSEPVSLTALRPGAPAELTRIVVKLLRKDRDERYQSAADLLVDLRSLLRQIPGSIVPVTPAAPVTLPQARPAPRGWVLPVAVGASVLVAVGGWALWRTGSGGGGGAPHIASLAVLPLDNMSADKSQDYFAAAMTEELTRELSGIKSLVVKSRTSTEQYKDKDKRRSMPEVARALNADGIIEGSVLRDGDRVRITAELIYGPADQHLWANSYDGDLHDVLSLQRQVAEAIAREVRAVVTPEEQQTLHEGRSIDPKAMELYLRGRESLYLGTSTANGRSMPALEQAVTSFTDALKIEPNWAEAYAGIAAARHWMVGNDSDDAPALFAASREAARKAIALDDRVAEAHGALAYVSAAFDWDLGLADREYRRAIALNNSYFHGYAMLLSALGRHDESKTMFDKAEARDPLAVTLLVNAALGRLRARDFAGALLLIQRLAELDPAGITRHFVLGRVLLAQGRPVDAMAELEQAGTGFDVTAALACALARAGRTADARARLAQLETTAKVPANDVDLATVYVSLGDRVRALAALENAEKRKATWLPFINTDPAFDDLHGQPRFAALLRRIGIPATR